MSKNQTLHQNSNISSSCSMVNYTSVVFNKTVVIFAENYTDGVVEF